MRVRILRVHEYGFGRCVTDGGGIALLLTSRDVKAVDELARPAFCTFKIRLKFELQVKSQSAGVLTELRRVLALIQAVCSPGLPTITYIATTLS